MTQPQTASIERTRAVMERYAKGEHGDVGMLSPEVVFRVMATGQEHRTPDGVAGMLDYFYHVAFDARAETRNLVVGEGVAVLEADFIGRHVGDFAGVPATDKEVRVPLVVIYDVRSEQIVEGRIYFETPAFLAQVGAMGGPPAGS